MTARADEDWRKRAACKGKPLNWWFPKEAGQGHTSRHAREAKAICHNCPVKSPCLEAALKERVQGRLVDGIRGGLTFRERKDLAATRRRAAKRAS